MPADHVEKFDLVIIGAGPAGLSAASRAAQIDAENQAVAPTYVLLEGADSLAQTIQSYQVGKHVMNEPSFLDLRSPVGFSSGTREDVLARWEKDVAEQQINLRYGSQVSEIRGRSPAFEVCLNHGESLLARTVIMATGTQGNLRRLGVEHDEPSDFIRYSLSDPREFVNKTILVVGAGDSAIENALALAENNHVQIINRRSEFSRAKSGNLNAVLAAINEPSMTMDCHYESSIKAVSLPSTVGQSGQVVIATPNGDEAIECDLVIARLGSIPPRQFLERMGMTFSSEQPSALPDLDQKYQTAVEGLYVVGGLSGYPLIKQAMNQGQDVVDYIHGNPVEPADHKLLVERFGGLYPDKTIDETLDFFLHSCALFESVSPIVFRELMIESRLVVSGRWAPGDGLAPTTEGAPKPSHAGEQVLSAGDFVDRFYVVVEGELKTKSHADAPWVSLGQGEFFGESCLFAGRSQDASVVMGDDAVVMQIPRRILIKLALSNALVRKQLDDAFVFNLLKVTFKPKIDESRLMSVVHSCQTQTFEAETRIYSEGEVGEQLYLLRSGTVNLLHGMSQQVIADQYAGELVGQLSLMGHPKRMYSAVATTRTDALAIDRQSFQTLLSDNPEVRQRLEQDLTVLLQENNTLYTHRESAEAMQFLMQHGLGEATDALIIDASLCVGCDNCEVACAQTHDGVSRLDRSKGPSLGRFHVPTACRHCEIPHCMKDCPPDAIHRTQSGSVYIGDNCIGCGNCEANCPYDAIDLVGDGHAKPGFWQRLTFSAKGMQTQPESAAQSVKLAVKCDSCMDLKAGPACVRACPTGAALRVGSGELLEMIGE